MSRMPFRQLSLFLLLGLVWQGCGSRPVKTAPPPAPTPPGALSRTGYTIQAGAFREVDNAVRLTMTLRLAGLEAYYFLYKTDLYKVRFGDFPDRQSAEREAKRLKSGDVIDDYYIVSPESYTVTKAELYGMDYLRDRLVQTAQSYLGLPYRWGGTTPEEGFDCSGLVLAVYKLNGLNLPRTSRQQFDAGERVKRQKLKPGDLVFFATGRDDTVSHVGIFTGGDRFIHAPGPGQAIRQDSLENTYFKDRFAGARTYL